MTSYVYTPFSGRLLVLVGLLFLLPHADAEAKKLSYNSDIRPILSDKCFACHGPDVENNSAGLRLDLPEQAYAKLKESSGHALVPGDAEASVAYQRIISDDPELVMPTPKSKITLSDREKKLIKQWIEEGAEYEPHWSFKALPKEVPLPELTKLASWKKSPIDQFVAAKLEDENLTPSSEADPLRWLRRVHFDLTGLPPQIQDIETFQNLLKTNPAQAYELTIDELLKRPSYGEHLATGWLDAARYADSYGYQSDKLNTQWPYRDWVVKAFNENLPYDKFVTWQLAGDLLEKPTREQHLATAFNRIHRLNNEGGAIFEEWRTENIADRVHTYGTAMLGLTMECSRCHDHKYDPITARDYYSLFSFFNSIDENGMYDRTEKVPSPSLLLPTPNQEKALQEAVQKLTQLKAQEDQLNEQVRKEYEKWAPPSHEALYPDLIAHLDFSQKPSKETYYFAENDHNHSPTIPLVDLGNDRKALPLDGDRGITVAEIKPFDRWTPFTVAIRFQENERKKSRAVLAHTTRGTDAGYNGWDLMLEDGHVESRLYRVWPGNAIGVRTIQPIPAGNLHTLTATYDASSQAKGLKLYLDGNLLEVEILRDEVQKSAAVAVQHGGKFALGYRFRDRGLAGALVDELHLFSRDLTSLEIKHLTQPELLVSKLAETSSPEVSLYFRSAHSPAYRTWRQQRDSTQHDLVLAEEAMQEIPVMKELATPRPAYILARGEYDAPKTEDVRVKRETFEHIGPRFDSYPKDRLGLAQWTLHPDHPLTSRVFVNRLWARFFGAGLVDTPENFGLQGSLPTHPELLDWLARDFISSGWDIKRLCKAIVLSATYRQDSATKPEALENDPANQKLARGAAYRLAAEQIRDLALSASGLMNPDMGGPPVSPYQPGKDLWREANTMSPAYRQSVGKSLYRRSLYSVWKRTAPLPNMMAFDATTREVCSVARSRTNTPLQALVLMNDVQFVEASRELAARAISQNSSESSWVPFSFTVLTGRAPDETESKILQELLQEQLSHYREKPEEAQKLIKHGEQTADPSLEAVPLAALTTVCQAILNLDLTIWRR